LVVANTKIDAAKHAGKSTTILMTMRGGATRGASPDEAHPGLYSKPLDAAIWRVLASKRHGRRHGR
jgi:hypothetical protein